MYQRCTRCDKDRQNRSTTRVFKIFIIYIQLTVYRCHVPCLFIQDYSCTIYKIQKNYHQVCHVPAHATRVRVHIYTRTKWIQNAKSTRCTARPPGRPSAPRAQGTAQQRPSREERSDKGRAWPCMLPCRSKVKARQGTACTTATNTVK